MAYDKSYKKIQQRNHNLQQTVLRKADAYTQKSEYYGLLLYILPKH